MPGHDRRPGLATHAGITLIEHDRFSTPAATSDLVGRIDEVQYDLREGPCLSVGREHVTILVDDLASDQRWPNFTKAATEMGVASMLSFQLFVQADSFGALNLYAETPHAFDDEDQQVGLLLAPTPPSPWPPPAPKPTCAALDSRDVIGQAKGILMERYKISAIRAFDLLIAASQHTNHKLREIADILAETGEIPAARRGARRDDE